MIPVRDHLGYDTSESTYVSTGEELAVMRNLQGRFEHTLVKCRAGVIEGRWPGEAQKERKIFTIQLHEHCVMTPGANRQDPLGTELPKIKQPCVCLAGARKKLQPLWRKIKLAKYFWQSSSMLHSLFLYMPKFTIIHSTVASSSDSLFCDMVKVLFIDIRYIEDRCILYY